MELYVRNLGTTVTIAPGETILGAVKNLGISYSCEDGRCGLCRCILIRGEVSENSQPPRHTYGCKLRYFLACQSTLSGDAAIEIPEPNETIIFRNWRMKASVLRREKLSENVRLLTIEPAQKLQFAPGQCAELELARGLSRLYSMAGTDSQHELSFHVRMHPHGRASHVIEHELTPGSTIRVRGPYGTSYLRTQHDAPILLACAGTGLAPILSILRTLAERPVMNPVHVYVAFMTAEEAYELGELKEILTNTPAVRSWHILIASGALPRGCRRGLLTEAIRSDFQTLSGFRAHCFGSPYAIDALVQLLRHKGISEEHLYADAFHSLWN